MNVFWVHTIVIQMHSVLMWIMAMNVTAMNLCTLEMEHIAQVRIH